MTIVRSMISHLAIPRLVNDGITFVGSGFLEITHPSIMTNGENSIHVQRIIAMVNWIGGPTLGKPFGGHFGNFGNTLGTWSFFWPPR
jgi:hypothetical protein